MCLIGVKETYVQEKKKVTKNFLGQICTTVSGLKDNSFWWCFEPSQPSKVVPWQKACLHFRIHALINLNASTFIWVLLKSINYLPHMPYLDAV